jgi:hypothetical protein
VFTAPYAVLLDAVSFAASALAIFRIRAVEETPPTVERSDGKKPSMWTELKEGLRFVLSNPNLRAQAGCTSTSNFFSSVSFSIILVYAVRELDLSPGLIGFVFSLGALGGLAAALTATRISSRFGIGPTTIVMAAFFGPTMILYAVAPSGNAAVPLLVTAQLIFGFTVVVYNIVQVSYRQAICPPRLQGRMNSVMRFIVWGTIPLGTVDRRRARLLDRPARDDRRGGDRRWVGRPLDRVLSAATSPGHAGARRRRARGGDGAGGSGTVTECLSCRRSKPGCGSSTRSSPARPSRRRGRRTSPR